MIELLGIGVAEDAAWCLRRLSARFEGRGLVAVLSARREERAAVLDVIAGRRIPTEGRAWIAGIPLGADTASRIRRRVGVVDVAAPVDPHRSVAWNVRDVERGRRVPVWPRFAAMASARPALAALERVGLPRDERAPASALDAWGRIRLAVARGLRDAPDCLVVPDADAHLGHDDARRLLALLRRLVRRDGVSVYASFGDGDLAREADAVLRVGGREPGVPGAGGRIEMPAVTAS